MHAPYPAAIHPHVVMTSDPRWPIADDGLPYNVPIAFKSAHAYLDPDSFPL